MSYFDQDLADAARDAAYDAEDDRPTAAELAAEECADMAEYGEHDYAAHLTIMGPEWTCATCGEPEAVDAPF